MYMPGQRCRDHPRRRMIGRDGGAARVFAGLAVLIPRWKLGNPFGRSVGQRCARVGNPADRCRLIWQSSSGGLR